jgi:hypothetical protein
MIYHPEKVRPLPKKERKRRPWKLFATILLLALLKTTIKDARQIDTNVYPPNQREIVIEIPDGTSEEDKKLKIAQDLAPDIRVAREDLLPEGGYGVMAQVILDIPGDKISEIYEQQIELSNNPHHLAILSFVMFRDNGAQEINIVIGNKIVITLDDIVLDTLDSLDSDMNLIKEHFNDVETIAFVLGEIEPGVIIIEKVLIDHHEVLTVYEPGVLRTTGDPPRLVFIMSTGKHAIYPNLQECINGIFLLMGFGVSTDVCPKPDESEVVEYRVSIEDMFGTPDNPISPLTNNPDFALFPEGLDARRDMLRPDLSFFVDD